MHAATTLSNAAVSVGQRRPALSTQLGSFIASLCEWYSVSLPMKTKCIVALLLCSFAAPLSAQTAPRKFELQANSPQFWKLLDRNSKLTKVAGGFGFTEGPVWDPAGFLYVSDETLNKIFRVYLDGRKEPLILLGDPDGNTFDREH